MTGPREVAPGPSRRSTRLGATLAGWLVLSLVACVVVLTVHRPVERPAGRTGHPASSAAPVREPGSISSVRVPATHPQPRPVDGSTGWQLRLFFTAASSYYHGPTVRVRGCPDVSCRPAPADLGPYPHDFVAAVRAQGSGRIDNGPHRGHYLDWDATRGYWLDTVPRGPGAVLLQPFVSVISNTPQLSARTTLRVASCGAGSRAGWAAVCTQLRAAPWSVATVAGTATVAGPAAVPTARRTVRLYVGTENRAGFGAGPWAETFRSAVLRVG